MKHLGDVLMVACLMIAAGAMSSCATMREKKQEPGGKLIPFDPATPVASLRVERAAYPSLFSPQSYALWVGPEITLQRRAEAAEGGEEISLEADAIAAMIDENFLVLECHMESVFEDMSISYDVVGFRGIRVYLQTHDGQPVMPVQILPGKELQEQMRGALRVFRRNNLVVFRKADLNLTVPVRQGHGEGPRLVLDGFNSIFYFEWPPEIPDKKRYQRLTVRETAGVAKMGYLEYYGRLAEFARRFD